MLFFDLVLLVILFEHFFFFFKQKTAYEMRISDWSSDVCSSDLDGSIDWRQEAGAGCFRASVPSVMTARNTVFASYSPAAFTPRALPYCGRCAAPANMH